MSVISQNSQVDITIHSNDALRIENAVSKAHNYAVTAQIQQQILFMTDLSNS